MKARAIILALLLVLVIAFMAVNWSAITALTDVSLGVTRVQAPLGLILLTMLIVVIAGFTIVLMLQQASMIRENRRFAKELAAQRALADEAEASRFTELRKYLDRRLDMLQEGSGPGGSAGESAIERIDRLEAALRQHIDQTGNTLAAYIGEVDDRVEKLADGGLPPPRP